MIRAAWQRVIDAAERHNKPGAFTTFVAYEWTSMPDFANLHRNVIFASDDVPPAPFASTESNDPEDLWAQLARWRERGSEVLAIPHNSNASKGRMFPLEDASGAPVDADYARRRRANEPVVEVTQLKGTSEIHPALTDEDELADFEIWNTVVGGTEPVEPRPGSYVRTAYLRGLALEANTGRNPYVFGLIGSSDSHDASSAVDESDFTGGHGNADATPAIRLRGKASTLADSPVKFSASGLAGIWAESNTREAIFAALRRRETFATSGPRIRVRLFAGTDFPEDLTEQPNAVQVAADQGVPMGGRLTVAAEAAPRFYVTALRDPRSAPLQRVQIVKGWLDNGEKRERIYDVACAGGVAPDPQTRRCPDNGATVDLSDCSISAERGAKQLTTLWQDPNYRPDRKAFYYLRAVQNPTCRWSTWDALRLGVEPPDGAPATIQERAWSSPIWVEATP